MVYQKEKLLILIVAFKAQDSISNVLKRVPKELQLKYELEVLIIDHSNQNDSLTTKPPLWDGLPEVKVTLLLTPEYPEYGENQKLGLTYAVLNHFDYVILLHGDGKYPPELIPHFCSFLSNGLSDGSADVVMGTRMKNWFSLTPLREGMPLVKFIGNIILTFILNKILGMNFSELHCGFRAYKVSALKRIPFERNKNGFEFDLQLLIQLLKIKSKVKEIEIKSYYGEELTYKRGLSYSLNCIKTSLLSRLHNFCILYQREYDIEESDNHFYSLKLDYKSSHTYALESVRKIKESLKRKSLNVLDIGCGPGHIGLLLQEEGHSVTGMDFFPLSYGKKLNNFYQVDLNKLHNLPSLEDFDCLLLLDVIEHLDNPEFFLDKIREKGGAKSPKLVITTGNIAFIIIRLQLLFSVFNYGKQGILDLTHKRLFTFSSLKKLLEGSGIKIESVQGIPAPFPKAIGNHFLSRLLVNINTFFIRLSPALFSYQISMVARLIPNTQELLKQELKNSYEKIQLYQVRSNNTFNDNIFSSDGSLK